MQRPDLLFDRLLKIPLKTWLKFVVGVGVLVCCILIFLRGSFSVEVVRTEVASYGVWAPLAFIILCGVVTTLPVPAGLFILAAGVLFGPVIGLIAALVGVQCSAIAGFFLSRWFAGDIARSLHKKYVPLSLQERGFLLVVYLRLLMLPHAVVSYASGISGVKFKDYFFGSLLGSIPGILLVIFFADRLTGNLADLLSWRSLPMVVVLLIMVCVPFVIKKYVVQKKAE